LKLYSPEKAVLMEVSAIKFHERGLLIQGKIMGTMPLKAILTPGELRAGFKLMSFAILGRILGMLFRRDSNTG
jgi:hypothetical protein